jgi:hypothetical protein
VEVVGEPDEEMVPLAMARTAPMDEDAERESIRVFAETAPVAAGSLRAPRRWEHFLTQAAVIGGEPRYEERLDLLGRQMKTALQELPDPDSLEAARIQRDLDDLGRLRGFAVPLVKELSALRSARRGASGSASWARRRGPCGIGPGFGARGKPACGKWGPSSCRVRLVLGRRLATSS